MCIVGYVAKRLLGHTLTRTMMLNYLQFQVRRYADAEKKQKLAVVASMLEAICYRLAFNDFDNMFRRKQL